MATGTVTPGYPAITPLFQPQVGPNGALPVTESASVEGFAVGKVVIGGTTGSGPTVTVTINGHGVTYTYVAGDTSATIAAGHIATAINADGTDSAIVTAANNSSATVTITAKTAGTAGEYTLTASSTGGATATASDVELDLSGSTFVPKVTFNYNLTAPNGLSVPMTFYKGFPYVGIAASDVTIMRNAGLLF